MNNLFIDLYSKTNERNNIFGKTNITTKLKRMIYGIKTLFKKYKLVEYDNDISLKVDVDYLNSISIRQNRKYSFEEKRLQKYIGKKFCLENKINTVNVIFSKALNEMHNNNKYLLEMLSSVYNINFKTVIPENQILKHDLEYIKRYCISNKLKKEKIKVLVIISGVSNYNEKKITSYINNFKEVDILITNYNNTKEIETIKSNIEKINNEYGSSISILSNKKDIKKYNIYIIYSKLNKQEFTSHFVINKKSKIIDINNIDDDILNDGYKLYVKNERSIKDTLLNLNLDINNFSIVTLGASLI